MAAKNYPKSRKHNIVVQETNNEVLIYDLEINKAFCLNETSSTVWELCDGTKSVSEISETMGKRWDLPINEDLVWLALDQLKRENLIENASELVINFEGLSRRQVIKKIGLGSMVALPIVASIIAPTAINAASGPDNCTGMGAVTIFNPCTMNSDCGVFVQPPSFNLCCRLAAFGARVCIITQTSNGQCDCTQP